MTAALQHSLYAKSVLAEVPACPAGQPTPPPGTARWFVGALRQDPQQAADELRIRYSQTHAMLPPEQHVDGFRHANRYWLYRPCPDRWSSILHSAKFLTATAYPLRFALARHNLPRCKPVRELLLPESQIVLPEVRSTQPLLIEYHYATECWQALTGKPDRQAFPLADRTRRAGHGLSDVAYRLLNMDSFSRWMRISPPPAPAAPAPQNDDVLAFYNTELGAAWDAVQF